MSKRKISPFLENMPPLASRSDRRAPLHSTSSSGTLEASRGAHRKGGALHAAVDLAPPRGVDRVPHQERPRMRRRGQLRSGGALF